VGASISPHVYTKAVLLIVLIVTLVSAAIRPLVQATPMHSSCQPVSFITGLTIRMLELAMSIKDIVFKLTFIYSSILSNLATCQALLTFDKHAFVGLTVKSLLKAFAVGAIIQKFSLINKFNRSFFVLLLHFSIATGHPVEEDTLNDCSSGNDRLSTVAMRLTPDKTTLVLVVTRELDLALAIREPLFLILVCCIQTNLACVD